MVARPIVVRNNFHEDIQEMKTNGKALEDSIQMAWTLKATKLLKGMNE